MARQEKFVEKPCEIWIEDARPRKGERVLADNSTMAAKCQTTVRKQGARCVERNIVESRDCDSVEPCCNQDLNGGERLVSSLEIGTHPLV